MVTATNWADMLKGLDHLQAATIVMGAPLQLPDVTLVPVAAVSGLFGSTEALGQAGGLGIKIDPVAMVVVQKEQVQILPLESHGPIQQISKIIATMGGAT